MKKVFKFSSILVTFLQLFFSSPLYAQQQDDGVGKISLNPYVSDSENIGEKATKGLIMKLGQIATAAGMSGKGFDNRFIITAHLQELDCETTATYPPKTSLRVSVAIYVGDGIDGTLFSSYVKEYKGIGNNREEAYAAAVRKLQVNDSELLRSVEIGKERIIQYYNMISEIIIKAAESEANAGRYEEAISALFAIPMACKGYDAAQKLISQYGIIALETNNQKLIADARSAWSSSPNEEGASKAMGLLNRLQMPSAKALSEAKTLNNEIAARLKEVSDREWKLNVQQVQNEHNEQMAWIESEKQQNIATVQAAASVARAYYNSRPRVIYHVHWW